MMETHFASPDRDDFNTVQTSRQLVEKEAFFVKALNSFPEVIMVLNANRQFVYGNIALMELFNIKNIDKLLGQRPEEIFSCEHSTKMPAGCGTSEHCEECGALIAILDALEELSCEQRCLLTIRKNEDIQSIDLNVWAVPMTFENQKYVVLTIRDVSDIKMRESLESIFLSDTMNEVNHMKDIINIQKEDGLDAATLEDMRQYTERIIALLEEQKNLLATGEKGGDAQKEKFNIKFFLEDVIRFYQHTDLGKKIKIELKCFDNKEIMSDKIILNRILGNLIMNAMEASTEGDTVIVRYVANEASHVFVVENSGVMPDEVSKFIFRRSFSTKGSGRGWGIYSSKLLTENYLKGRIYFKSTAEIGTRFLVEFEQKESS